MAEETNKLYCGFCGKGGEDAQLIANPNNTAAICLLCLRFVTWVKNQGEFKPDESQRTD